MKDYNYEKLLSELKIVRLLLIIYTILHPLFFILFFTNFMEFSFEFIFGINIVFILTFLSFIWLRLPISKFDKIGETILISLFGLFALWMWIPDRKQLKEMIIEYKSKYENI